MHLVGKRIIRCLAGTAMFLAIFTFADGNTIYVNNKIGSDTFDGRTEKPMDGGKSGPVATITQGLKIVPVGGKVSLANTGVDYREEVLIKGLRKGRAATPLVIDGNGATVSGLVSVPPSKWIPHKEDIYYFENKINDNPPEYGNMPQRNHLREAPQYFFLNGKAAQNVISLESIPVGAFFYDTKARPMRIYFRLPSGVNLSECSIELPISGGVFVADDDYVVVRNLRSQYSWNDGFAGFWGIGVVFENCHATYNCDEGISLHGTSSTIIDGGLVENTFGYGIADVMSCLTTYRNVVVRNNQNAGVLLQGAGHVMLNCQVYANEGAQIVADGDACLALDNCLIIGDNKDGACGIRMNRGHVNHCTIVNCAVGLAVLQGGWMRNCVLENCSKASVEVNKSSTATFSMANNFFSSSGILLFGEERVNSGKWKDFSARTKAVTASSWHDLNLKDPLYAITQDSSLFKAGEYGRTPGAVLPPFDKWDPDSKELFIRPPP